MTNEHFNQFVGISKIEIIEEDGKYTFNNVELDVEDPLWYFIENFDFNKYDIDMIVTEITDIKTKDLETYNLSLEIITNTNLYNLLIRNNYKLINWVNADLIFVRNRSNF